MTTQKAALSQAQQREIYTREGWVNGYNLGKLNTWSDGQEMAPTPDELTWRKLLNDQAFGLRAAIAKDMRDGGPGKVIDHCARRYPVESIRGWLNGRLSDPLQWFVQHLNWDAVEPFVIGDDRLVLVDVSVPREVKVIHLEEDDVQIHELSEGDVFDAALETWKGKNLATSVKARRWLFIMVRAAIMLLRDQAGVDFDTSVAVSADGKRVLAATHVVVYSHDAKQRLTFRAYQSVAFLLHKIRLAAPHVIKLPLPARKKTEEELLKIVTKPREIKKYLEVAKALKRSQILVKLGELSVLFIHASDVPEALKAPLASTAPPPATSSDALASSPTQPSPGSEAVPVVSVPPPSRVEVVKPVVSSTMPAVLDPNNAQGTPSSTQPK